MRVALVHDWLTGMRGGEKCLEVLCEIFPDAPIYTLLHNRGAMSPLIESREIHTSFIQRLPFVAEKYRLYLPLFPGAIESFNFSEYDVILSTSHCVAKGAVPREGALHICYCHTPMRYVWEMYDEYFGPGRANPLIRGMMRVVAPRLRRWDVRTAERVDYFIANSENVQRRIQRIYGRSADVIFPPVDTQKFSLSKESKDYYLIVSALVPYKRLDLAIEVFNENGQPLMIVGKGPEEQRLRRMAGSGIRFVGWQDDDALAGLYAGCRALIFPGEEDFGIVPLEAMASGKPVVAYARGGALETVVDGMTGVFFRDLTAESLQKALSSIALISFDPRKIREHALRFSRSVFKERLEKFLDEKIYKHAAIVK